MTHYDNQHLTNLTETTKRFHELLESSRNWVKSVLELEEKENLLNLINQRKSDTKTISESINTKPVFALFGQSQVGKSYLAKTLLSLEGKSLDIVFPNDQKFDFLEQINPVGNGAESTGVVTRFSLVDEIIDVKYPVKVSLLDIKDIILIICDSYYSDTTNQSSFLTNEDINNHLLKFSQIHPTTIILNELITGDDIYCIKRYFETFLKRIKHSASILADSKFWVKASEIIPQIESGYWTSFFEILWGNEPHFSKLFSRLINALQKVNYHSTVFVNTDTILRDKGKILDVDRISEMFKKEEIIAIKLEDSSEIMIDIYSLSALTLEIRLPVSKEIAEEKEFLKYTDLLDFPGARSREPIENVDDTILPKMYLRGKISYLFNKYSSNYEINNLLFCVKNLQNEVKEIPLLINDWIKNNIGSNSEERQKRIGSNGSSPLFIVLTFYNETLEYNSNSDAKDLSHKWDNRFIKIFKNEIVSSNKWDEEWTTEKPNFNNLYLLRDFTFSDDTFAGFAETKKETSITRPEYYERLKASFKEFPYIKAHFDNPESAWESSTIPNNDGSNRVLNDLIPAANNRIKIRNYHVNLEQHRIDILTHLKKHYHSDDVQEQRNQAFTNGSYISEQLLNLFSKKNHSFFGDFLTSMYLSNTETYNFIHENYLPAQKDLSPSREEVFLRTYGLDLALSVDENIELLKEKLSLSTIQEVDNWLINNQIDLELALQNKQVSAANNLVDGVIELWKKQLHPDNFRRFEEHGLDLKVIPVLSNCLKETFDIFQVRQTLIKIFERKTRLMTVSNDTDEYLASIICSYINDFVSNFGFNFMMDERKKQVLELAIQYKINTRTLMIESGNVEEIDIRNLFEEDSSNNNLIITYPVVDHYNSFLTKIQLILLSNCGFRTYDILANDKLDKLIKEMELLQLK